MKQIETNLSFDAASTTATIDEPIAEETEDQAETKGKKGKKKAAPKKGAAAGPTVSVDQVCDTFVSQANFFENAIVRERVF